VPKVLKTEKILRTNLLKGNSMLRVEYFGAMILQNTMLFSCRF